MIVVHHYAAKREKSGSIFILNLDAPLCPSCGSLCSGYDTRVRRVICDDGSVEEYRLRRVRCGSCRSLHLELPDFILPRKRYAAAVIEAALEGRGDSCPAEASTIWRWRSKNHPPEAQCSGAGDVIKSSYSDTKEAEP